MLLDEETIAGIVHARSYTRGEAAALQDGVPLTAEQRRWWNKYTLLEKAQRAEARARTATLDTLVSGGPMSGAERVRKHNLLKASIDSELDDAISRINKRRRARAEKSLLQFTRTYGADEGGFLEDAPSPRMEKILDEMQAAVSDSSIPYHIRVARGHGKTSYAKCAVAWAAATGLRKFIVAVGSNTENAKNIVDDVFNFFQTSPKFAQDFPEVAVPIRAVNGVHQRAAAQTYRGKPTRLKIGMGHVMLPTIEGSKSSGCIIQSVGFATSARGKVHGKQRPDLLILDDLQSDDLADNEERVLAAVAHIKKTFMGLAGHKKKIAAVMTSTPIEADDLSETFARDRSWKTTTHKMVLSWPKCWHAESPADDLWAQYRDLLQREIVGGNPAPHVPANRFYRAHRAAMDAGAVVLNPGNYDRKTELSGIQHAMNILFRDGEAVFDSEYQMQPRRHVFAFEISAELILARIRRGVPACTIPENTELVIAATDINPSYGLTTAVVAFAADRTALVTAYHVTPVEIDDTVNDTVYQAKIYDVLLVNAHELRSLGLKRLDAWTIDAGGKQINPVTKAVMGGYAASASGAREAFAFIGRPWKEWSDHPRSAVRSAINNTVEVRTDRGKRFTFFNADLWKETAQKSWATETGGPGGLSLFDGQADHTKFAIQVANEKIQVKKKLVNGYDYKWRTKNPHDYGDCLAMCYATAAKFGLTGDGSYQHQSDSAEDFVAFL